MKKVASPRRQNTFFREIDPPAYATIYASDSKSTRRRKSLSMPNFALSLFLDTVLSFVPFNSHGKCAITAKRLINAGPRPRVCLITHPVSTVAIVSPLFTPLLKLRLHCRLDPLAEEPALVRMVAFGVCRLCRKRCIRTDSKCD